VEVVRHENEANFNIMIGRVPKILVQYPQE